MPIMVNSMLMYVAPTRVVPAEECSSAPPRHQRTDCTGTSVPAPSQRLTEDRAAANSTSKLTGLQLASGAVNATKTPTDNRSV